MARDVRYGRAIPAWSNPGDDDRPACSACGQHVLSEDMICPNCGTCTECGCACVECPECASQIRYGSRSAPDHAMHDPGQICSRCSSCTDDHCECSHCERCGEPVESTCTQCDRCENCCYCVHCDYCGEPVEFVCERCDCCEDHCNCVHCDSCGDPWDSSDICDRCNCCADCCNCRSCDQCGQRVDPDDYCSRCHSCDECCSCGAHPGARGSCFYHDDHDDPAARSAPPATFHGKDSDHSHPQRFCGCEIEVGGLGPGGACAPIINVLAKWDAKSVTDGSLKRPGFEIVTAPAKGKPFHAQVQEVTAALESERAFVTEQCGFHVHIDARDLFFYELRRLVTIYRVFERAVLHLIPEERRRSDYVQQHIQTARRFYDQVMALPLADPKKSRQELVKLLYGTRYSKKEIRRELSAEEFYRQYGYYADSAAGRTLVEAVPAPPYHFRTKKGDPQQKYHGSRYYPMNLHSWYMRGTVEFRVHQGTVNYDDIVNWAMLWSNVVNAAAWWSQQDLTKWLKDPQAGASANELVPILSLCPSTAVQEFYIERFNTYAAADGRAPFGRPVADRPPLAKVNPPHARKRARRR